MVKRRLNRRGSILPVMGAMLVVLAWIVILIYVRIDRDFMTDMGQDQNQILDSYTVAEGGRMYIQRAAEYSIIKVLQQEGCDVEFDDLLFKTYFDEYMLEFPTINMWLYFDNPYETVDPYDVYLENNVLSLKSVDLLVKNCLTREIDGRKITNCPEGFVINTEFDTDFEFDLDVYCKSEEYS